MSRFHRVVLVLLIAFLVPVFLGGCNGSSGGKPIVAVTTPILGDFVHMVGGDKVEIRLIAKPLEDPRTLKITPEHTQIVAGSRAVFYNGFGLEPWLDGLVKSAAGDHKLFVATKGIAKIPMANGKDDDPHAWMDPTRAMQYLENARDMLIDLDSDHEADYRFNCENALEQIRSLDGFINTEIGGLSSDRKRLLLPTDSMRYFGARYEFQTRGLSPIGVEPTDDLRKEAMEWLAEKRIPSVFIEAGVDEEQMRKFYFKRGGGTRISDALFTVTLDVPGKPGGTYIGAMKYNVQQLSKCLR